MNAKVALWHPQFDILRRVLRQSFEVASCQNELLYFPYWALERGKRGGERREV